MRVGPNCLLSSIGAKVIRPVIFTFKTVSVNLEPKKISKKRWLWIIRADATGADVFVFFRIVVFGGDCQDLEMAKAGGPLTTKADTSLGSGKLARTDGAMPRHRMRHDTPCTIIKTSRKPEYIVSYHK